MYGPLSDPVIGGHLRHAQIPTTGRRHHIALELRGVLLRDGGILPAGSRHTIKGVNPADSSPAYLRRLCVVWMAWGWLLIMVMCQCPWCSSVWWRAHRTNE